QDAQAQRGQATRSPSRPSEPARTRVGQDEPPAYLSLHTFLSLLSKKGRPKSSPVSLRARQAAARIFSQGPPAAQPDRPGFSRPHGEHHPNALRQGRFCRPPPPTTVRRRWVCSRPKFPS